MQLPRAFNLALTAILASALSFSSASHAAAVALPVELSAPASAAHGDMVTLVATAPVADANTVSETLIQVIDPTKLQLTSTSQIVAPAGWTVLYSTDGTNFTATAPTTAAGWAAVRAVKATGAVVSQGATGDGLQILGSDNTVVPPSPPSAVSSASGGDGFDVVFDNFDHIFNIYHHNGDDGTKGALSCHLRSTGAVCPGTWPWNISLKGVNTQGPSNEYMDTKNQHIWFATETQTGVTIAGQSGSGFACIDVSVITAVKWCGGSLTTAFKRVGGYTTFGYNAYNVMSSLTMVGGRVFAVEMPTGRIWCLDPLADSGAGALCPTPYVQYPGVSTLDLLNINAAGIQYFGVASMRAWQGKVVAASTTAHTAICFDPITFATCSGWANPITLPKAAASSGQFTWNYEQPNSTGTAVALCWLYTNATADCFNPNGTAATVDAGLSAILAGRVGMTYGGSTDPLVNGTKVLFVPLYRTKTSAGLSVTYSPYCWDVATRTWCSGWSGTPSSARTYDTYTIRVDPDNDNCYWTNSNAGIIATWDINGGATCVTPPNTVSFDPQVLPPRMSCAGGTGVTRWGAFTLTSPLVGSGATAQAGSAYLSVADTSGTPIPGWQNIPIPASQPATSPATAQSVDLSSLSTAVSGQHPIFTVKFANRATTPRSASANLTAIGDRPQLCLTPTVKYSCPTGIGPLPPLTNQTATVTASASVTVSSGSAPSIPGASAAVTINVPAASACGSAITGTALDKAGGPIAGVTVALTDASGQAVLWPAGTAKAGQPVTTTTAANGTYEFPVLIPASYEVRFPDQSATMTVVNANTVSGAAGTVTGIANAVGGSALSKVVTVAVGTAGVVNAVYVGVITAAPDTSVGLTGAVQTLTPLANDRASTSGTLVNSSVKLCSGAQVAPNCTATSLTIAGQGIYTVNANGTVTFTPCSAANTPAGASCVAAFVGTATPVKYQVSDSNAQTTSSTLTPAVSGTVTALPDTTIGAQGAVQTAPVLLNDPASVPTAPFLASSIKLCSGAQTQPNCTASSVSIPGQGKYTVDTVTGAVKFTPCAAAGTPADLSCTGPFTGTATAVTYQATNQLGQTASSTYTPTVVPIPVASADTSSGPQGVAQSVSPLTNDSAASGASLVATSVRLCSASETAPNCTATSRAVAGQGTYSVDAVTGQITFTPLPTFTGTASAVPYCVVDNLGQSACSSYTPTVIAPPTAAPDSSLGEVNAAQSVNPLDNDSAFAGAALDPTSVRLCAAGDVAPACGATAVVVSGQGTYEVDVITGLITFTPVDGFLGTATPVLYSVADTLGQRSSTTYTPRAVAVPSASPDASIGPQGVTQAAQVLANDQPSLGASFDTTSLRLCLPEDFAPDCTSLTLDVPGEGTYTVDPITGTISFAPLPSFVGLATPVTYSVSDTHDRDVTSSYTPEVVPRPQAKPDATTGPQGESQSVNPLANDLAGSGARLDTTSVRLCGPGQVAPACTDTSVVVEGEGTYSVDPLTGVITFTPLPGFTGLASGLTYCLKDSLGQTADSVYRPTVVPPPTANADTSTGPQGVPQSADPVANDSAGSGSSLVASTVRLCGAEEIAPACTKTTLTVTGEGTYSVDAATGRITFTPVSEFAGVATGVTYCIEDALGQIAASTYTPTVIAPPVATIDTSQGAQATTQSAKVLANDTSQAADGFDVNSLRLCATGEVAPACTATTVVVVGQGVYRVDSVTGVVSFTPEPEFTGTATGVAYVVADSFGQATSSRYTPTVIPRPVATPDATSGPQGAAQKVDPLGNDSAGSGANLVAGSVRLCGADEVAPTCTRTLVSVPGEGTFTVDSSTGAITFLPAAEFTGTGLPVTYIVLDDFGQATTSIYTPTVIAPPIAAPESTSGPQGVVQSVQPLTNDVASVGTSLVASSVRLCAAGELAPGCASMSVTVSGEGVYSVDPVTGVITFTPEAAFAGTATGIAYSVEDALGQLAWSTYTPTVIPPPTAVADTTSGPQGAAQSVNPLTNDAADSATTLRSDSVTLCSATEVAPACAQTTLTVAGQGTYSVDGVSGVVTFVPEPGFTGEATGVAYCVEDALGQVACSRYTPTVIPRPSAVADATSGPQGAVQTTNPVTNDTAGTGAILVAGTVRLCGADEVAPACTATTVVVAGQGVYRVDSVTGVVSFTPEPEFTGTATGVAYVVADSFGQATSSRYTPTVIPRPVATPDATSGPQGAAQKVDPLGNDSAGSGANLVAGSVRLCGADEVAPACTRTTVTVTGVGVYSVDSLTGQITFTPVPAFAGVAPSLAYCIKDSYVQVACSAYTPTVVARPTLKADKSRDLQGVPQTVDLLVNDSAGAGAVLDVASLRLCGAGDVPPVCSQTSLVVAGEGTYSLDSATGLVTFTPEPTFSGVASGVRYSVADSLGQVVSTVYTPTVVPPPAASPDRKSVAPASEAVIDILGNDEASVSPLVPGSLRLCGVGEVPPDCSHTKIETEAGWFYVDSKTGKVTFKARQGFRGPYRLGYRVMDDAGQVTSSTITIVVPATDPPADLASTGGQPLVPAGFALLLLGAGLTLRRR